MIVMVVIVSVKKKSGESIKRNFTEHITEGGGRGKLSYN